MKEKKSLIVTIIKKLNKTKLKFIEVTSIILFIHLVIVVRYLNMIYLRISGVLLTIIQNLILKENINIHQFVESQKLVILY